jgi:hypothetical protein
MLEAVPIFAPAENANGRATPVVLIAADAANLALGLVFKDPIRHILASALGTVVVHLLPSFRCFCRLRFVSRVTLAVARLGLAGPVHLLLALAAQRQDPGSAGGADPQLLELVELAIVPLDAAGMADAHFLLHGFLLPHHIVSFRFPLRHNTDSQLGLLTYTSSVVDCQRK